MNLLKLRKTFDSGKTKSLEWRRSQLFQLKKCIQENEKAFYKHSNRFDLKFRYPPYTKQKEDRFRKLI